MSRMLLWTAIAMVGACARMPPAPTDASTTPDRDAAIDDAPRDAVDATDASELADAPSTCGEAVPAEGAAFGPLPLSCLPRCSAATRSAIEACDTDRCIVEALAADTTPDVAVEANGTVMRVGCNGSGGIIYQCLAWQTVSCEAEACPSEFTAWSVCNASMSCTTERAALDACTTSAAGFDACVFLRTSACFAS